MELFQSHLQSNCDLILAKRPASPVQKKERKQSEESHTQEREEPAREKGLREIFAFYCRQQLLIGKKATFEQLESVLTNMNLGEFMKLCKDFAIPISATKIKELFKKTAKLSKELDWSCFTVYRFDTQR